MFLLQLAKRSMIAQAVSKVLVCVMLESGVRFGIRCQM